MYLFALIFFFLYCPINDGYAAPNSNTNDANALSNGKLNETQTCKTDDGRFEIPINVKIRTSINPCKVCTCTAAGFLCEDQCETFQASTSIGIPSESSSTTTLSSSTSSSSSSSSTDQSIHSSIFALPAKFNANDDTFIDPTITTSTVSPSFNGKSEDTTGMNVNGPCARLAANGVTVAREYAFVDCSEVYLAGKRTTGIYEIWPRTSSKPFQVLCDMETDGGGWTVLQRRGDFVQQSNFFVSWASYKRGFGDLTRDFWLGNERIHSLTAQDEYRLHIDMEDFANQSRFVEYEWFFITNEQTKYILNLGRYMTSSTGGDSLSYNRGMRFTTRDQDNDHSMSSQCAETYKSGWWHAGCTLANLNGLYLRGSDMTATGVFWNNWLGVKYSLKTSTIRIRPTSFHTEMLS